MNNTTRMVSAGGARFVLRVYNNHKDVGIVQLEHEVLKALQALKPPFLIPIPVQNEAGQTVTIAPDGSLATLVHYIEGERANAAYPQHIYSLGLVTGQMTSALSRINPSKQPLYSPYYLLDESYANIDDSAIRQLIESNDAFASRRQALLMLQQERRELKEACISIAQLPKQWIHGDLVFNNTVAVGDHITGVLDYEFCTVDVRLMELAVIAADLLKPEQHSIADGLQLLLQGFRGTIELSEQERRHFVSLVKLRLLDVVLHFINRYNEGLDSDSTLCSIIDQSAFGMQWMNSYWEDDWL